MDKQKVSKVQKKGSVSSELHLSASDVSVKAREKRISPQAFSTWVRALLQNWRQGTVSVKDRSEVSRTNKKPWKQKGTGRARAGTARSPLWRGGGVIFGPQPRVKSLKVSKKVKQGVLNSLLFDRFDSGNIMCLDWSLSQDKPSTAQASKALKDAGLHGAKINLFLRSDDSLSGASFANLLGVRVLFFDQANAFDLAHAPRWVVLKKDLDQFKEMVSRWS